jgi:3'-phosphoadenosine 5'-phosphosulfate sulfotransferase
MNWSSKVGLEAASNFTKQERNRQEAIYEFIETEKAYIKDMQIMWEHAIYPIMKSKLLSDEELVDIFSNFGEVVVTSKKICKAFVKRAKESEQEIELFGDILVDKVN